MTMTKTLESFAKKIEDSLPGYLPALEHPAEASVLDAMRYSLLGGGKRVRGALTLGFYELFSEDISPALPYAGAVEMIHAYSLIHDDLPCMDDSDTRRGKLSCHIAFGQATAVLAGDALLNLAFETMSNPDHASEFASDRIVRAIRCLSKFSGYIGMIGGQAIDLAQEGKDTSKELMGRLSDKNTGELIKATGEMGCILGGANPEQAASAISYCEKIGLAFQIVDDILDVVGNSYTLGKPIGNDTASDKSTWVSCLGLDEAKKMADDLNRQAKESVMALPGDKSFLISLADKLAARTF